MTGSRWKLIAGAAALALALAPAVGAQEPGEVDQPDVMTLESEDGLKERFNAAAGAPRLVLFLSPT